MLAVVILMLAAFSQCNAALCTFPYFCKCLYVNETVCAEQNKEFRSRDHYCICCDYCEEYLSVGEHCTPPAKPRPTTVAPNTHIPVQKHCQPDSVCKHNVCTLKK